MNEHARSIELEVAAESAVEHGLLFFDGNGVLFLTEICAGVDGEFGRECEVRDTFRHLAQVAVEGDELGELIDIRRALAEALDIVDQGIRDRTT